VIPAAPIKARSHSIVSGMAAASYSIDEHLPDAMLDLPQSVLDPRDSLRAIHERNGCVVAQRSDGRVEPSESFIAGSKDLNGTSDDSDQRLRNLWSWIGQRTRGGLNGRLELDYTFGDNSSSRITHRHRYEPATAVTFAASHHSRVPLQQLAANANWVLLARSVSNRSRRRVLA